MTTNSQSPATRSTASNTAGKSPQEWINYLADGIWALHRPGETDAADDFKDHRIYVTTEALAKFCGMDEQLVLIMLHLHQSVSDSHETVDMLRTIYPGEDKSIAPAHNAEKDNPYPYRQVAWLEDRERKKRITAAKAALTPVDEDDDDDENAA